MQVKLSVLTGTHAGKEIALKDDKFVVGRSEECQLRPKSESVSRRHCVFVQKEGRVFLADLKSRNGTFVNDVRLEPEKAKVLKSGDRVRIGLLDFQILIEVGIGGAKKPEVRSVQEAATRVAETSASSKVDSKGDISDIDSWLSDPDTLDRSRYATTSSPETTMLAADDTHRYRVDANAETNSSNETVRNVSEATKSVNKKVPMKLPKTMHQGPTTKNSKDAASNALKKYFGG
jgi:pSer/pThr/pTyr-binding forkhead associated (FHA) protein